MSDEHIEKEKDDLLREINFLSDLIEKHSKNQSKEIEPVFRNQTVSVSSGQDKGDLTSGQIQLNKEYLVPSTSGSHDKTVTNQMYNNVYKSRYKLVKLPFKKPAKLPIYKSPNNRKVLKRSIATVSKFKIRRHVNKSPTKKLCIFYTRFGKCSRKERCPYVHDSTKVAVCTRYAQGKCVEDNCPFLHQLSTNRMPVCHYFLKGVCNKENCPYLHINLGKNAEVCQDFVNGYCSNGAHCKKLHTNICLKGKKCNNNQCKLKHKVARPRKISISTEDIKKKELDRTTVDKTPTGSLSFISLGSHDDLEISHSCDLSPETFNDIHPKLNFDSD
ncbi:DgyrCDS5920 [Dimorphilus gyrociliatus]|uniref:DgyrCDS5920 n=1 Tax=Dimorphilus gyrociliatus TaxID=2664684 RepID=A0A7I8VLJ3_9ANNE|nr:DgyrCDS5920 [Dimorphilus gyrociliatus]